MTTVLKVGELAKRTGLTVRTLHHYDDIGLLSPSERTRAGHRLYGADEVRRLQQIASLRHLGLSLEEVRACLEQPEYSLPRVLELQIERIDEQIERQGALRQLIERLRDRLASTDSVSVEDLTRTIEVTVNFEKHFSPDQMSRLSQRRAEVGDARVRAVEDEWTDLFAAFGRAMEDGVDPASPEVMALARRAAALIEEFTGGDPGITRSLGSMYRSEGAENIMQQHGMSVPPGLWEYMGQARQAVETRSGMADRPSTTPDTSEQRF